MLHNLKGIELNETLPFLPHEISSVIRSDWHIVRARGKATIIPLIKYLKAMGIDIYVIHDGDYGLEGAEVFNIPIQQVLDDDSHLVVLSKCIEDALGYPMKTNYKPLHAYNFIKENWHYWNTISEIWRSCVEIIFNQSRHIVVKEGIIE